MRSAAVRTAAWMPDKSCAKRSSAGLSALRRCAWSSACGGAMAGAVALLASRSAANTTTPASAATTTHRPMVLAARRGGRGAASMLVMVVRLFAAACSRGRGGEQAVDDAELPGHEATEREAQRAGDHLHAEVQE